MSKEKDFIEKSFEEMTEDERLKYEIAVELGLADKVKEEESSFCQRDRKDRRPDDQEKETENTGSRRLNRCPEHGD